MQHIFYKFLVRKETPTEVFYYKRLVATHVREFSYHYAPNVHKNLLLTVEILSTISTTNVLVFSIKLDFHSVAHLLGTGV